MGSDDLVGCGDPMSSSNRLNCGSPMRYGVIMRYGDSLTRGAMGRGHRMGSRDPVDDGVTWAAAID